MEGKSKIESWQPEIHGFESVFTPSTAMVKATKAKIDSLDLSQDELEGLAAEVQMLFSLAHELDVAFAAPRKTIAHTNMMMHFRELLASLPVRDIASDVDPYDVFLQELMTNATATPEVCNPAQS